MLNEIEQLFEKEFLDFKIEIRYFECGCCDGIRTKSFYFDKITADFFKSIEVKAFLRSVDILHLCSKSDTLVLGEMTSYRDYETRIGKRDLEECLNFIRNQLLEVELRDKIIHSIFTITKIMDYYNVEPNAYACLFDRSKLTIKNFLILDLTYDEYLYIEFGCLDKLERHKKFRIEGEIDILNCTAFEKKLAAL